MKFGNVALYCKGWYAHRKGGCKNMWMDMIHCINADGYCIYSKQDVVSYCLHRMDDMRNDPKFPYKHQLDFSTFYKEINDIKNRDKFYYYEGIDYDDAIILYFRNVISNSDKECFDQNLVKPNENVLPLHYNESYYCDGDWLHGHPEFSFGDMHCDVIDRINKMFPNYDEQNIDKKQFEDCEAFIGGKNWENVIVRCGTDNLIECEEVEISGKLLNNPNNIQYRDNDFLNLSIYEHCVNFNNDKTYLCRVKKEITHWNWGDNIEYKLVSIIKEY